MKLKTDQQKKCNCLRRYLRAYFDKSTKLYFLFIGLLCLFLIIFYTSISFSVETGLISRDFVTTYIYLNSLHPTISGFFLYSYMHNLDDIWHLIGNVGLFLLFALCISLLSKVRLKLNIPLPKNYLKCIYGGMLIGIPILVILGYLVFTRVFVRHGYAFGFSGVVFAVFGVTIYLAYTVLSSLLYPYIINGCKNQNLNEVIYHILHSSAFIILVAICVYYVIMIEWETNAGGALGHAIGLIFGIIIASCSENILQNLEISKRMSTHKENEEVITE